MKNADLKSLIDIPLSEREVFKKLLKDYRKTHIRDVKYFVDVAFNKNKNRISSCVESKTGISTLIHDLRELAYNEFLEDEHRFNVKVLENISEKFKTPASIMDSLLSKSLILKDKQSVLSSVKEICGKYAAYIMPYIYQLSLSNTNSRRSRAGSTFQEIIYHFYEKLGYSYDSQKSIGRNVFEKEGLGKIVDSVLPGIVAFSERRDKVVIGTMKTTLRERWQEVIEEISRTNIPNIFLLTMDNDISTPKAKQMAEHNVVLVVPSKVKEKDHLNSIKSIIDFETFFFQEIPSYFNFWKKS